jgi:hypothetical protein
MLPHHKSHKNNCQQTKKGGSHYYPDGDEMSRNENQALISIPFADIDLKIIRRKGKL